MLRPCPFCGSEAVEYRPRGPLSWTVECGNEDCPVKPMTHDYGADDCTSPDPRTTARNVWNGVSDPHQ